MIYRLFYSYACISAVSYLQHFTRDIMKILGSFNKLVRFCFCKTLNLICIYSRLTEVSMVACALGDSVAYCAFHNAFKGFF